MRLTKEQVIELRKLKREDVRLVDVAKKFNITPTAVLYYLDEDYRRRTIERVSNNFKTKTKGERSEIYKKRLPYMKKYYKRRYASDKEFREKHKKRVRDYNQRKGS